MKAYSAIRRIRRQLRSRSLRSATRPLVLFILGGMLAGCTSTITTPPTAYLVSANYDEVASCLYRETEKRHVPGRDIHLTRLSNPSEIRLAALSTSNRPASLSWEMELLPQSPSTTRLLVRQAGTLVESGPFWSSYLAPAVTSCAGSAPVPAP